MTKAIFLDRDGVVNVEKNYLYKIEEFEFIDGIFESLKKIQSLGYKIFIITNQSGISRGYYSVDDFEKLTSWMLEEFRNNEIVISQVEFCPHGPNDNCLCRKPKSGMIDKILKNYDIDLKNSWLVGDKSSDIECAQHAGISNTIQVKSGHKFKNDDSKADYICESIKDIDKIIQT
ncbi:D-glycero-beta-D-manno-heptose 1,7-bisphosphate 7-phosphatase [Arcobacter sp. CECT 8983]|uniref:D-glycero-beta-D-manno-heptose 1,7-bisphosphate 7-phosphatase n=1 Tax=Arcobacter sp. CECT 8983 TaxID=2044508 RepID=UPI002159CC12|nr:D-glycero-beta-D-manno-heptose 1,7-bisphosphate 7-phosphatase [Arcobacter sp. CECT 8983]